MRATDCIYNNETHALAQHEIFCSIRHWTPLYHLLSVSNFLRVNNLVLEWFNRLAENTNNIFPLDKTVKKTAKKSLILKLPPKIHDTAWHDTAWNFVSWKFRKILYGYITTSIFHRLGFLLLILLSTQQIKNIIIIRVESHEGQL